VSLFFSQKVRNRSFIRNILLESDWVALQKRHTSGPSMVTGQADVSMAILSGTFRYSLSYKSAKIKVHETFGRIGEDRMCFPRLSVGLCQTLIERSVFNHLRHNESYQSFNECREIGHTSFQPLIFKLRSAHWYFLRSFVILSLSLLFPIYDHNRSIHLPLLDGANDILKMNSKCLLLNASWPASPQK
jgi:hypothetical protein